MKILEKMLNPDPSNRPDFQSLLQSLAVVGEPEENEQSRNELLHLGSLSLSQHQEVIMRHRVNFKK